MSIRACAKCGAKNRVDEQAAAEKRPVCGRCGSPLGEASAADGGKPLEVTDATFERDVIEASRARPVLVDFWAEWCGPCRMVGPVVEALAAESGGRYRVVKVDVDTNQQTAAKFNIRSIPALFIFKDGEAVERLVGAQPKNVLAARVAAHL